MGKINTSQLNEQQRPHGRRQEGQTNNQISVLWGMSAGGRDASRGLFVGGMDTMGDKRGKKQTLTLGTPHREKKNP